jgi:hypothetical protein
MADRVIAQQRALNVEKLVVLGQPHRHGDLDQKTESPLGRFAIRHKLRQELYDAGIEYGTLVRRFYAAKLGTPAIVVTYGGSGKDISSGTAKWLAKEIERLDKPLRQISASGLRAVRMLAVHELEISDRCERPAVNVLYELALLLRKLGRSR